MSSDPLITTQERFDAYCEQIRQAGIVAFDTEFVSEFTWRPELCLLQLATPTEAVIVDPFPVSDLRRWWEIMRDPSIVKVIHGGREEVRFCVTETGEPPVNVKDVQIAEAFRGRSFPLGYEALVKRVLNTRSHGRETRSDWRRRPLTRSQIEYGLEDVRHILPIWKRQSDDLKRQGRLGWAEDEFERLINDVMLERSPENWLKLSGLHRLNPRELAVARDVFRWREREAQERNRPVRKILRDDLIIELARRQPDTLDDLMATRDMNRGDFRKSAGELLETVLSAMKVPDRELPRLPEEPEDSQSHDEQLLGQLLSIALANRCAELNVALSIVGKNADLRHLVRWHVYENGEGELPRLMQGWRAEVCGDLLTDVLDGRIALRVADPQSDHPLVFEQRDANGVESEKRVGTHKSIRPFRRRRKSP